MARILGIDIDAHSVRAAWLETAFRGATLTGVGYAEIPYLQEGDDPEAARRGALRELLVGQKPPDQVVVSIPGSKCSLRTVELAPGLAGKVHDILPHELAETLPFAIDEVVIDHQVELQTKQDLRVLALAARKSDVRELIADFRGAGIEPREVAGGAAALDGLMGILPELAVGGPHVLVFVATESTDVCVVEGGRTLLARTLSVGADRIDRGRVQDLAVELTRTLAALRSQGFEAPSEVLVAGVRSPAYLAAAIEAVTQLPARPLELPAIPGVDANALPAFVRAASLAARSLRKGRRFDLRKGEFAPPRAISGLREHRGKLTFGALMVFAGFFFSVYVRYNAVTAENAALTAKLRTATRDLFGREVSGLTEARQLLEGEGALADPRPRLDALAVLDLISSKVPASVNHETYRLRIEIDDEAREGQFEISGVVPTIGDRDTIATALEQHECVTQVDRGPMTPAPNNGGQNYRLEGAIQCPTDRPAEEGSGGGNSGGAR